MSVGETGASEKGFGIRVFSPHTPPAKRRGYIGFLIYFIVVVLCTVWPIYLVGNRVRPFALGMPFSMFWIVLCLLAGLVGMIFLYLFDEKKE